MGTRHTSHCSPCCRTFRRRLEGGEGGDIHILDLRTLNLKTGAIEAPIKATLPPGRIKAAQTITATYDPDRFLVSSVNDYSNGLATLSIARDEKGKATSAALSSIRMSQDHNKIHIDRLNIQRAQSAVLVEQNGIEYAIVSDDNYNFLDPYWKAMYEAPEFIYMPFGPPLAFGGSASAKKVAVGGKLGIVQDPFGKQGQPKFLGATLPLDGYGIVNLALSEDGKVLIGQLKGGFSANIFDGLQKSHQNHAWNVEALIAATLAHPEDKRMSKHIKLPTNAEQYIAVPTNANGYTAAPAGTMFDPEPVNVLYTGNMGDVVKVDLKELAARKLLNIPDLTKDADITAAQRTAIDKAKEGLKEFNLSFSTLQSFGLTAARSGDPAAPQLLIATKSIKVVNLQGGETTELAVLGDTANADFANTGILYLVPNITDKLPENSQLFRTPQRTDIDKLRSGQTLAAKAVALIYYFQDKRPETKPTEAGRAGSASVGVGDYATAPGVFFGDRPLENPGYSRMTLSAEVKQGSTNKLDVLKVEQRLKYFGYSDFDNNGDAGNPRELTEFDVDGEFDDEEENALRAFWAATHYAYGSSSGRNGIQSATTPERKTVVPGSFDADTNYGWLNAYNAPHWMNAYASVNLGTNPINRPRANNGTFADGTSANFEIYATSWMVDLLKAWERNRASQGLTNGVVTLNGLSDPAQRDSGHARGGHSVGMALDLGFKADYIWEQNWSATNNPASPTNFNGTGWSMANARDFSNLLTQNRGNDQAGALRNFLSIYALTIADDIPNNGTWEDLQVVNGGAVRMALFGTGAQTRTQLIQHVWLGNNKLNAQGQKIFTTYDAMHAVMNRLGITAANGVSHAATPPHQHHFHVDIRPPERLPLTGIRRLVADAPKVDSASNDLSITNAEAAVIADIKEWAQTTLSQQTGDEYMFAMPAIDASILNETTVLVARQPEAAKMPVYGACFPLRKYFEDEKQYPNNGSNGIASAATLLSAGAIKGLRPEQYLQLIRQAKEKVLSPPKYGQLVWYTDPRYPNQPGFYYVPNQGYAGKDRMTMGVEMNGKTFQVEYFIQVLEDFSGEGDSSYIACKNKMRWRISQSDSLDISSTDYTAWQRSANLSALIASAQQTLTGFTDLPATALGQTVGSGKDASITLDQNAAGHGWYVDPTPLDSSDDYLPTSSSAVWQAKAGSAAAGKMDMLSVLLHEYGHALGLEHSAETGDFMNASLQPGMRKLPTAEQLSLMSQLVAQLKAGHADALAATDAADHAGRDYYQDISESYTLTTRRPA